MSWGDSCSVPLADGLCARMIFYLSRGFPRPRPPPARLRGGLTSSPSSPPAQLRGTNVIRAGRFPSRTSAPSGIPWLHGPGKFGCPERCRAPRLAVVGILVPSRMGLAPNGAVWARTNASCGADRRRNWPWTRRTRGMISHPSHDVRSGPWRIRAVLFLLCAIYFGNRVCL